MTRAKMSQIGLMRILPQESLSVLKHPMFYSVVPLILPSALLYQPRDRSGTKKLPSKPIYKTSKLTNMSQTFSTSVMLTHASLVKYEDVISCLQTFLALHSLSKSQWRTETTSDWEKLTFVCFVFAGDALGPLNCQITIRSLERRDSEARCY